MIDTYNFHGHRLEFSFLQNLSAQREKAAFHFLNLMKLDVQATRPAISSRNLKQRLDS